MRPCLKTACNELDKSLTPVPDNISGKDLSPTLSDMDEVVAKSPSDSTGWFLDAENSLLLRHLPGRDSNLNWSQFLSQQPFEQHEGAPFEYEVDDNADGRLPPDLSIGEDDPVDAPPPYFADEALYHAEPPYTQLAESRQAQDTQRIEQPHQECREVHREAPPKVERVKPTHVDRTKELQAYLSEQFSALHDKHRRECEQILVALEKESSKRIAMEERFQEQFVRQHKCLLSLELKLARMTTISCHRSGLELPTTPASRTVSLFQPSCSFDDRSTDSVKSHMNATGSPKQEKSTISPPQGRRPRLELPQGEISVPHSISQSPRTQISPPEAPESPRRRMSKLKPSQSTSKPEKSKKTTTRQRRTVPSPSARSTEVPVRRCPTALRNLSQDQRELIREHSPRSRLRIVNNENRPTTHIEENKETPGFSLVDSPSSQIWSGVSDEAQQFMSPENTSQQLSRPDSPFSVESGIMQCRSKHSEAPSSSSSVNLLGAQVDRILNAEVNATDCSQEMSQIPVPGTVFNRSEKLKTDLEALQEWRRDYEARKHDFQQGRFNRLHSSVFS